MYKIFLIENGKWKTQNTKIFCIIYNKFNNIAWCLKIHKSNIQFQKIFTIIEINLKVQ